MAKLKLARSTGKRACIYLRKSTDAQEASIPGQRQAAREYASKHGYQIVAEFVDSGISGVDSSAERKEFQRLIAAAERGEFEYVIAWDMSRITRSDPMETMAELRPLKRAGVRVVTTDKSEPIDWDSFAGVLMLSIEAESNSQYVKKLARGTTRGQASLAKQGLWVAGRPPLGYSVGKDKKLVLGDPGDVEAVRWAFNAYASGESMRGVQTGLKQRGQTMVVSSVRWLLMNRLYAGDFVWGRNTQAKFYSLRGGEIRDDFENGQTSEVDQVIVRDNHPAIVERKLFDSVQAMFSHRKRASTPHQSGGSFVLTGLLRCADCGYGMIGMTNQSAKAKTVLYRCGGSQTKGVGFCHPHMVKQEEVLKSVFEAFKDRYANPQTAERLRTEVRRQLAQTRKQTDVKALENQLAKEQAKFDKASRRLVEVDNDLVDVVQKQVRAIKAVMDALQEEIRGATVKVGDVLADIDSRAAASLAMFERFEEIYRNAELTELRGFLLETVDHIDVNVSREKCGSRHSYKFVDGQIFLRTDADLFDSW